MAYTADNFQPYRIHKIDEDKFKSYLIYEIETYLTNIDGPNPINFIVFVANDFNEAIEMTKEFYGDKLEKIVSVKETIVVWQRLRNV